VPASARLAWAAVTAWARLAWAAVTASARLAPAAPACGLLAALLLPHAPAGLGVLLVAVALALTVAVCTRAGAGGAGGAGHEGGAAGAGGAEGAEGAGGAGGAHLPRIAHPLRAALLGAFAVALAASAAFRDAGWVVAGELAAAVVVGSIAVSCPRGWRATALASVAAPLRMASGLRRVATGAAKALPSASGGQALALSRGLLLSAALVATFGALFAAGDAAFAQIAGDVLPDELPLGDLPLQLTTFAIVTALAGGLVLATGVADASSRSPLIRIGRTEWLLALGPLILLFGLFVAVQLAVLFGGDGYVLKTAGVTYAQYAREGFAQLVVVAVLTLAVVAAALRWARAGSKDARLLRALLATLCLLALVVLASGLHRLGLYERAFGFTRTRLAVDAFLLFGAALFALVIVALAMNKRAWLPRATVLLCAVSALAFWASDPDRRIARHNVERFEATGSIDVDYLSRLSADAVPALVRLPRPLRDRALAPQRRRLARGGDGFAGANLARARARRLLAAP
jgi:hypothetical protein